MPVLSPFITPEKIPSRWQWDLSLLRMPIVAVAFFVVLLQGCGTQGAYREEHRLANLNVVFLDQPSLHKEWEVRTGTPGVEFVAFHGQTISSVKTLQGFYDFSTQTLYCPKWNFEVCGHELHHAVLGHFHKPQ